MDEALEQDILDPFRLQQRGMARVIIHQLVKIVHQLRNTTNLTETVNDLGRRAL